MSNYSKSNGRRSGRGPRRSRDRERGEENRRPSTPAVPANKPGLWQKIVSLFTGGSKPSPRNGAPTKTYVPRAQAGNSQPSPSSSRERTYAPSSSAPRVSRKPEAVEVTTAKLYVGNLSFDASESDLSNLFNGVGVVKTAEIVSHKHTEKSKGFGFVTLSSVDEAKRAVEVLHDKDFMGRKLVVSGAKTPVERDSDRDGDREQESEASRGTAPAAERDRYYNQGADREADVASSGENQGGSETDGR